MPEKKKPRLQRPKRNAVTVRLLDETKEMLDRAAAKTDTTQGRYVEKALRAQFKKDGID
jgi:predicted transcriptional regulator